MNETIKGNIAFGIIKPNLMYMWVGIFNLIEFNGFEIIFNKDFHLTREDVKFLYGDCTEEEIEFLTSAPVKLFLAKSCKTNSFEEEVLGSIDPEEAAPNTIRRSFGTDRIHNGIHWTSNPENVKKQSLYFLM